MTTKYTLDQIRDFWTRQAVEHGQSPSASWSDHMVIEMEIREIGSRLQRGDHVLDVGCANGYTTISFAAQKQLSVRGLDYIPEMIAQAQTRLKALGDHLLGTVEFAVGDIIALQEPEDQYDKVVVIRVVINLGTWENQVKGLRECARVLRPGGVLLVSEATLQGWTQMNKFRHEFGLPDIPMPSFNLYLDEKRVVEAVADTLVLEEIVNFSSTYYVGTRVLKPVLYQLVGLQDKIADPLTEWNRWFSSLPAWGDYGTQKLFIFRKK
jgi:ubiquinone/menaquinone biosynthesis C-methylase UbiE